MLEPVECGWCFQAKSDSYSILRRFAVPWMGLTAVFLIAIIWGFAEGAVLKKVLFTAGIILASTLWCLVVRALPLLTRPLPFVPLVCHATKEHWRAERLAADQRIATRRVS